MTTYAYARVSTDSQTLAAQLQALSAVNPAQVFTDDGISGSVPYRERPGMMAALAVLQPGDTLVTFSLSRLGRSSLDLLSLMQELDKRKVKFRSLSESFDTSTAMGKAVLTIMAAMAQLERDMAIERTNAGIQAAKARGVKFGRAETEGRREAVASRLARGMGIATIAADLDLPYNSVKRMVAKIQPGERAGHCQ